VRHPALTPAQLLDQQMDLMVRLERLDSPVRATIKETLGDRYTSLTMNSNEVVRAADAMAENLNLTIKTSEAFYVTKDLSAELQRRADDESYMPQIRQFDRAEAPTLTGFVYIEGGLPIRELRGRTELAHWLIWGPATASDPRDRKPYPVIAFWMFNDTLEPDEVAQDMEPGMLDGLKPLVGRFLFQGADVLTERQRLGPMRREISQESLDQLRTGDKHRRDYGEVPPIPERAEDVWFTNSSRYLVALWDLLNEEVGVVSHGDARLDRAVVRRAKRMNLPGRVTVVKLRRAKYVDTDYLGERHVDWSHRWLVRGHWRNQACGPGRTQRQRIWIPSHIKGPEDKPLVQSEKVYRLDR
jgi:hypothetical protein